MRPARYKVKPVAAVCAVLVALVVAGCGSSSNSSSAPGVTATSITFGTHQPLTGPAAPGYSEIAPASQAFFDYLNAQGGIYGRKIHLIIKNDEYNPTQTVSVIHQLVLQNNVFGIFEGLGTPTHTKVVGFLNSSKVPDMFVASGCACWDDGTTQPYTYGWQTNYTIEGKILGQYIKQHFAGKKIGVFYQDDDFGNGGLTGIKDELPASSIVSAQPYQPGGTNVAPQISAIKAAGAEVLVDFTVPIYTALGQLTSFTLGYKPQLVVSNVGIDPTTVGGLLKTFSKGKAGTELIEGAVTDGYLPSSSDTVEPVDRAVQENPRPVRLERAVRRQRRVRHGQRLHARADAAARGQGPHPRKADRRGQRKGSTADRPRPRAVPLLEDRPRRLQRRGDRTGTERQDRSVRRPAGDRTERELGDHPVHDRAAGAAEQRGECPLVARRCG